MLGARPADVERLLSTQLGISVASHLEPLSFEVRAVWAGFNHVNHVNHVGLQ